MTKYPCGNDIAVNWTLDLGGMSVDLAECSLLFEYYTGLGSKTIPGSEYSIDGNVLSWTFKGEDQVVYGVYGLRLVASSGGEDIVFKKPDAFEIVHGIAADEEQTLPLASSVETEQEPAADPEPEQSDAPVYVSSSPIHVEKVPLGSNITVRWRLLTTEEFDFRLEDCTLNLYYAAAGSGFKMATGYTLDTTDGYVLVWNFAAGEQVRYGLYSLLLDVRQGGTKVATLVKDDAFALVHRRGSVFPDRVIDFESVVTTMGGGALYTLLDVINDGYSTVYRSDGVTPAQRDDLLVYNGAKWYAIDAGSLSAIRGLRNDFASLELTTEGIFARVTDLEGDIGELWLTAREFGVRMSDAEGYIGQLTLTAREFEVRMSDAEGNIGQLSLTAQQFAVRMSDAEGNIGQLALTAQQFGVRMSDIEGNVGELALTAEEFGVRMTNAEGSIGQLSLTAEEFAVRMSDTEGNVSLLQQTATSLTSQIQDAQGNISTLQQTATSLTSRIQNAEGSISTIAQTAESIQLQVDNQQGDIASLEVSARAITSRVSDAEGNISTLEQTASSLTSQIEDAEGNISTLQQTAASLTSQIEDAEGNISTLQQTATQISSRVTSIEGEFGEGGRVTVAESTIVQQAGLIATKVSQTDYDANNQAISTHFSTIEQTASQISTRVAAVESEFGEGGRVTVAESTIVQQAGLIATKVSQTEYDANNQAISTHFSTIEQTASQISTRVAAVESEFGEGGRVTVAESTIVQQAGLIATKVSQTDYDANNQAISTRFSSIEQTAGEISASVTNVSNNLSSYEALTDAVLTNLQDQIDGVVETWYAEGAPTLSNYPVNTWAQADYPNHIGDLYYDKATGKAYRFMLDEEQDPAVYVWVELADEDIAKALALAGEKRRVFVSTPYAPYDAGDLWVKERTVNGETTREIYRCKRSRAAGETIDLANDWVPADDYAVTVNKANLKILADAIVGEVAAFTYDSEGKISSSSKSNITQTADAIRLSVSNQAIGTALGEGGSINDALLDTGIDITNGDITLTANHINLQNQSAVSGLELVTIGTGANQRVVIDVSSLNVNGIFTTTAWSNKEQALQGYADSAAGDAYTDAVAQAATDAASYITTNVAPLITTAQNTANAAQTAADNAQSAVNGLGYLAAALENGTTAIGGGLILSSLIGLGGNSGSGGAWELWSGVNGQYDSTKTGYGIAAWYGGPMVDLADVASQTPVPSHAKTLFRMDGSGYLADGAISWGAAGDLHLLDNVYIGPNMDQTLTSISTFVTLLSTWFEDDTIVINGVTKHVLRINMDGDEHDTGFAGVVWNGFLISGGDQIVISGTPGGGGGGGATNLKELEDVYHNASGVRRYSSGNVGNTDLLGYDSTKGWYAVQLGTGLSMTNGVLTATNTSTGTVTQVKVGSTAYNPTDGVVSLPAYPTTLPASDVSAWAKASTKPSYAFSEITGTATISQVSGLQTALDGKQPLDADLTAIAALTGPSSGHAFLKRKSDNTWVLDSNTYLTGITSTMVTNALGYIPADRTHLLYSPSNSGVLVKTNLAATSSAMLEFVIEGNGYSTSTVVFSRVQAYNYPSSDAILSGKAINYGTAFSSFSVFNYNGYIYLWFQRLGDYQTFRVSCFTQTDRYDHVDEITSAGIPSGATRRLDITPDNAYTTANLTKSVLTTLLESSNGYYVKKSGDTMSGALTVNSSFSATGTVNFGATDYCVVFFNRSSNPNYIWAANTGGYLAFGVVDKGTTNLANSTLVVNAYGIGVGGGTTANSTAALNVTGNAVVSGSVKIGSATISWNSNGYLHIDKPLVTAGDQIVISGTPGGGGGGGATNLWGLDDVNIPHDSTYPGNGDLLSYDLSTHKWVNVAASSVGRIYSAGTGISISASNAISLASGVCTAGTYYKTTVDTYGRVTAGYYADLSAAINGDLGIGSSNPQDADYYIAQYAGGGTTTTSYHRRPHSALYSYINTKLAAAHAGLDKVGTVTKVSTGTGLTGGDITSTGTISINSTYQTYITNGNTAHGWGNHASAGYVKLNPGASEQTLQSSISTYVKGVINLWRSSGDHYTFLGFSNGTTETYLGGIGFKSQSDHNLYRKDGSNYYKILDENNYTSYVNTTNFPGLNATVSSITLTQGTGISITNSGTAITTSGTRTISLASGVCTTGTYKSVTVDTYGRVTSGTNPTNLAGYGITDAIQYSSNITNLAATNQMGYGYTASGWNTAGPAMSFGTGNYTAQIQSSAAGNSLFYRQTVNGTPENWVRIYHSGNSNKSDVAWACSSLTVSGNIQASGNAYCGAIFDLNRDGSSGAIKDSTKMGMEIEATASYIAFKPYTSSGAAWGTILSLSSSGNVGIGTTAPAYKLDVNGQSRFFGSSDSRFYCLLGGAGISLNVDTSQYTGGWNSVIRAAANGTSIAGLAGLYSSGADPVRFWYGGTSQNDAALYIPWSTKNVGIGTTEPTQKLHVAGAILSSGDQVVSSDRTLKENLTPVTYSVSDIAKTRAVEFDWKDGRGHSMGSIAQDWLSIAPALVHGEEGNMSLAYGQLALVNTILLARQSESHEERIARLEKENAELKEEVKRLRMN